MLQLVLSGLVFRSSTPEIGAKKLHVFCLNYDLIPGQFRDAQELGSRQSFFLCVFCTSNSTILQTALT